jgi:Glu-tRNA(Gln) amidotransferase subunit E-like FAD-binding protein
LKQITDTGAIEALVDDVLAANAANVAEFKAGKEKAFNALVGQVMKAAKGKANPQQVNDLLKEAGWLISVAGDCAARRRGRRCGSVRSSACGRRRTWP